MALTSAAKAVSFDLFSPQVSSPGLRDAKKDQARDVLLLLLLLLLHLLYTTLRSIDRSSKQERRRRRRSARDLFFVCRKQLVAETAAALGS